ncbi:MAG: hypothetical protein ACKO9I_18355 [Sphaerospermopsis kisseleviana]|uniref:Uncharacterized protein n=1 Tax=Sphaerospermopsis reniformis TaxID=531300 RepID=A0A480A110_9CYAN|nr:MULTISPECIES: hypothetical protein [Sphaerospermopsis]MBD2135440.1 hypothetical protein [Sphaerospermopsis sp. FACHB-1094]MBD2146582.1 hypothetical protein [Sphaerospermopsis sp. FACHB-1194]GCL37516.1 hypothetical protein SR1949_26270 [Sphaerospermopsis reniformis]
MNIKLDKHTPDSLASLFVLLMEEGMTPNQILVGIVRLATDSKELEGTIVSADCIRFLLSIMPLDASAPGVTGFVLSLAKEGVSSLMLFDALGFACYVCGLFDTASLLRLTYQRLQADKIISQMLRD